MASRKGTKSTAKTATTTTKTTAKKTAVKPMALKTNDQHPEAGREPSPVYRADHGEGLPDQASTLNPNRAK